MSSRLAGKVALVTGAARGMGRSHAVHMAAEGADIIAIDICADIKGVVYPLATAEELEETAAEVEKLGRRIVTARADVRDAEALKAAVALGVEQLGRLDIACANAGVCSMQAWDEVTPQVWHTTLDVNLTGVWNTAVAAVPHMLERGGSIIIISSSSGIKGHPFLTPYVASKFGVVGIAKSLANELASKSIRVNTVHPAGVQTPLLEGVGEMDRYIALDPNVGSLFMNSLPVNLIEAHDVSNAVVYLASDEARYVTGQELAVDAGTTSR
jgi:SDR family mycofactocin-dependent oxidoreductase